jgi:hypothetical protein
LTAWGRQGASPWASMASDADASVSPWSLLTVATEDRLGERARLGK